MFKNILTSLHGWTGILAAITWLDGQFAPILPAAVQNWVVATLALITFLFGARAVRTARAYGVKGL